MESESFWTGIPGILTALAGLVAAVGSLIGVLHSTGVLKRKKPDAAGDRTAPSPAPRSAEDGASDPHDDDPPAGPVSHPPVVLRSVPAVLSPEKLSAMLVARNFFDKRRNAVGDALTSRYETRVDGEMLMLVDERSGLIWEMNGSESPMGFDSAPSHADRLNTSRAGGFADWRIPTAEEVMSLMIRDAVDGFHINPQFRREVYFIWTADQIDEDRAWVAYFADGILAAESRQFNAWVRAVR